MGPMNWLASLPTNSGAAKLPGTSRSHAAIAKTRRAEEAIREGSSFMALYPDVRSSGLLERFPSLSGGSQIRMRQRVCCVHHAWMRRKVQAGQSESNSVPWRAPGFSGHCMV